MPPSKANATPKSNESKLARLGLRSDMDLVLHLPLRYEDETEVVPIREACLRGGYTSQVEGVVVKNEIAFRPRRQLLVTIEDDSGNLLLRFMNFYGSQVKQLAEGTRVRARAELKHGFFGAEMVHPTYKVVNEGAPLPTSLTPVYPSGEGLSQTFLRRAITDAMKRIDWTDTLPPKLRARLDLMDFEPAVKLLHYPPQDVDPY
ncbi:MAG TPA: ATP-dependent DNA helicase RecG, partial [Telluria sp.]|nr:ATP-dependent DNA helicase RecG [Telluria sp.]